MEKFKNKLLTIVVILLYILSFALHVSAGSIGDVILPTAPTDISLLGIVHFDGGDRTSWQSTAVSFLSEISNASISTFTAFNKYELYDELSTSDIFVIHTHGSKNSLMAINSSGAITRLYNTEIDSNGSLSDLELAFIGACSTGEGGVTASNIVTSIYNKGADCVIGYKESVLTDANYLMIREFCKAIGYGYTIANALAYADAQVLALYSSSGNTSNRLTLGDTSRKFSNATMLLSIEEDAALMANTDNNSPGLINITANNQSSGYLDFDKLNFVDSSQEYYSIQSTTEDSDLLIISDKYTLDEEYFTEDTGVWTSIYRYYISDLATSDAVFILRNASGEQVGMIETNAGVFDEITLNNNDIVQANEALQTVLGSKGITDYTVLDSLLISQENALYIRYSVEYTVVVDSTSYVEVNDFVVPL